MIFELMPWEVFQREKEIFSYKCNSICLLFFDSYIEQLVTKYIWKKSLDMDLLSHIYGEDVTTKWMNENTRELNLFSSYSNFVIWQSDRISKDAVDIFLEDRVTECDFRFIFCSSKQGSLHKKIESEKSIVYVKIMSPKHWEWEKYLDFLSFVLGISLERDARDHLLELVPSTSSDFITTIKYLRDIYGMGQKINLEQVQESISSIYVNKFDLVKMLGNKDFRSYYRILLSLKGDFQNLRENLSFSSNYLVKFIDVADLSKKSYLSKYDRDILSQSVAWKRDEIDKFTTLFNRLEIMSKSGQDLVWQEIGVLYQKEVQFMSLVN